MGSQNKYLKSRFSTFEVNIQLLVATDILNNAKEPQNTKIWTICTKNNKAKLSYNLQFRWKPAHARTRIYLTNKLFEILFHMFSYSVQNKIIIKQSFYFYHIQLVVKKSPRTSWISSFLTGNFQKSAMLHSSAPLHPGKSVIFSRGKVPIPFNLYFNIILQPGLHSALAAA